MKEAAWFRMAIGGYIYSIAREEHAFGLLPDTYCGKGIKLSLRIPRKAYRAEPEVEKVGFLLAILLFDHGLPVRCRAGMR